MPNKRLLAQKNFLGSEGEGFVRRGQAFDTSPAAAQGYVNQGLAIDMPSRPTKEQAAASHQADITAKAAAKAAKAGASETKESTAKDDAGLESWPLQQSEESYLAQYGDDKNASDSVKEKVKLARARIRAGQSSGAS